MRGRDEETGEFFSPSRSEQRRAALDVLELGEQLVEMSAAQLARLPISNKVESLNVSNAAAVALYALAARG